MTFKNIMGITLTVLIALAIFSGFGAFRVVQQMTTPATTNGSAPINRQLGELKEPGLLDGGIRHHSCQGDLLLNREVNNSLLDPLVALIDEDGKAISEAVFFDNQDPRGFVIKIPEGHTGLARMEAPGSYRMHTLLRNNCFYSLFDGALFKGTVRGHAFVLEGEKLPDPEILPETTLIIETANGWREEVATDSTGSFRVSVPPGPFAVLVRSDTHADAFFEDLVGVTGETIERQIILPAGCELEGFVLGENVTLEGAKISMVTSMEDNAEATSVERGFFSLPGLTQGFATIYIQYPGYQEESFNLLVPGDKIGIRKPFLLKPSQEFTATAITEDGTAINNATILVQRQGQKIFEGPIGELNSMNIMAAGQTYLISAQHNLQTGNPATTLVSPRQTWTMPAEGSGKIQLTLRPGGFISGAVLTAQSWQPYGGASVRVTAINPAGEPISEEVIVWCDPYGIFKTPVLPPGKYAVAASHPHYGVRGKLITVGGAGEFSIGTITLPE